MEAHKKWTRPIPKPGRGAAILTGGLIAALSASCVQPTAGGSPAPAPRTEVPRTAPPVTVAMTQTGEVDAVFQGQRSIPRDRYRKAGTPVRRYHFGTAHIADPAHPSAVCFWDESDKERIFCWPNDRPAWIQLSTGTQYSHSRLPDPNAGRIVNVHYQSDDKKSLYALRPIEAPIQVPGKDSFFLQSDEDPCWVWYQAPDGNYYDICICCDRCECGF
jgi:hypothetical protein